MTDIQRRAAAKQFAADWQGKGDEKQETQRFWLSLLQNICGVAQPTEVIEFEKRVEVDNSDGTTTTKYIDGYIADTRVLIEQKGRDIDLSRGYKQSDGAMLTPFRQGRRYGGYLPQPEQPRWIVVCNFQEFHIHDMRRPNDDPEVLKLADLAKEYSRLDFLVDTGKEHIKKETAVSLKAGELVGVLYDALLKQYKDPGAPETLKSLNKLCVRLVFCLYAEDAGIFGCKSMFHDYLENHRSEDRRALINLFRVLDQDIPQRDEYMDDDLAAFPYVNGGLFADEDIKIPRLGDEVIDLILHRASEDFDWSEISPTIFGAVFESTLNPETRRSGGMHYTSIENIHKVIDPLFLDDLKAELATIKSRPQSDAWRKRYLKGFKDKLAELTFFDPACGSGNFLTETYISLRRLENEVIQEFCSVVPGQFALEEIVDDAFLGINVSIGQFYGIEINDFAVTVAKTALWIAESQMLRETEKIVHRELDFLPLKSYANIIEDNALRRDWESVVPKRKLNYIMGNPPFVGARLMDKSQKEDLASVFSGLKNTGNIDYVSGWYKKVTDLMRGTAIKAALVSTNSITQGEQVPILWGHLFEQGVHIDFAYRTFRWDSEAKIKAHVHCVIVGFSTAPTTKEKLLYTSNRPQNANNINAYLVDGPNVLIESRKKPICPVPNVVFGSMPNDGGFLSDFSDEDRNAIVEKYPDAEIMFRKFVGATEFLHNKSRWCLWLKGISPAAIKRVPPVMEAISSVRAMRESSNRVATRKLAEIPALFGEIRQPEQGDYIIIPRHSSENRKYVPLGFMDSQTICGDSNLLMPNATLYDFGILMSNVHNAWMRTVCGRIKSDYRYSVNVVYNNFPWPTPTVTQSARIEQTAKAILDARALFPDCSLADFYGKDILLKDLLKAHQENDRAVMDAYGFTRGTAARTSESACVAELMKMYQTLTGGNN